MGAMAVLRPSRVRDITAGLMAVATVEIIEEVVVASRPVRRGQIITEADVTLRAMDVSQCPENRLPGLDSVLGKRARRNIDAFSVLRSDMVELPPVVRRGDMVQIVAETDQMTIRTMGVVKSIGGREGDRVQVVNIDSDQAIYGRVVNSKTVTVEF